MEGFTIVDAGVAVIIIFSAILAYSRGFVREALAIAGWIAAAVLAYIFAPQAEPLVREIPVLRDFLDNCTAATIAAFAGVFALALVVFALFTPVFSSVVQRSALNAIDQGLGFLFGVVRGVLLIVIALVVYDFAVGSEGIDIVENSRSAQVFASMQQKVSGEIADQETALQWLTTKFEALIESACGAETDAALTPETPPEADAG
ncbi:CvpA family protein [Tropicimonas isoalkanivorans]|uniref:Membrane protein required for colicin V production n=1 Tax=Tropicimonas isoalkanivorans TaxID=441112 RepID=A0A1I1DM34_9RHOB|nr:CvpA family protein [Tropicimonas isoalkanivorans]SFB75432.1 membrane protein required for colicin V production [Tropicimonas isoalkanivorans]